MSVVDSLERRTVECEALPQGWRREESCRRSGIFAGKIDVCYFSPTGKKYRSKPELVRELGESVDLTSFDFHTGKVNPILLRKNKRQKGTSYDYSRNMRVDAALVPPIRQTASIFKQPVTVYRTQDARVKSDIKPHATTPSPTDKPRQLFWEKRLQNLCATDIHRDELAPISLPPGFQSLGPNMTQDAMVWSISTALHLNSGGTPITGQEPIKGLHNINPDQPIVKAVVVTEDDIQLQEEMVLEARKKLQEAIKELE